MSYPALPEPYPIRVKTAEVERYFIGALGVLRNEAQFRCVLTTFDQANLRGGAMNCEICYLSPFKNGLLCSDCLDELSSVLRIVPEQIAACGVAQGEHAWLIDCWGRAHSIGTRSMIGRHPDGAGISANVPSVSRHHAYLRYDVGAANWAIRDLGSSNGTTVNDVVVDTAVALQSGDRIGVGLLMFFFLTQRRTQPSETPTIKIPLETLALAQLGPAAQLQRNAQSTVPCEFTEPQITLSATPEMAISFAEPTGGGGGVMTVAGRQLQLSTIQFELMSELARRITLELDRPRLVRGFIRTMELATLLSWDTCAPNEQNVKQLVRRTRRMLIAADIGNLIEARPRFGYRLCVIPK